MIYKFFKNYFLYENKTLPFSDSSARISFSLGRMHYVKREYGDEITVPDKKYSTLTLTRFSESLREFIWFDEKIESDCRDVESECFAPGAEWFVKRGKNYCFAAKGGHNQEPHNHNDVGSFVFLKGGEEIFIDTGSGKYTRQYFSNERYTIFEPSSRSHNVPIIDGEYQKFGREYAARDFKYEDGILSFDIAGAYGLTDGETIKRSFAFGDDFLQLTDSFELREGRKFIDRLVTKIAPKLDTGGALTVGGAKICYDRTAFKVSISSELATVERKEDDGNIVRDLVYLIDFEPLSDDVSEFEVKII